MYYGKLKKELFASAIVEFMSYVESRETEGGLLFLARYHVLLELICKTGLADEFRRYVEKL